MDDGCRDTHAAGTAHAHPPGAWLTPDSAALTALANRLRDGIVPHLDGRPIVYADIPVHLNVGDLLINLGAELLFADHGVEVRHRVGLANPQRLFRDPGVRDDVIVLHGGGNFSDLYPRHGAFRRRVLESFPDTPVILLPQTVHYDDPERLKHDLAPWIRHRKLVFMARDTPSHALIAPLLGERALCLPDAAHYVARRPDWLRRPAEGERGKLLVVGRRDIERHAAGYHRPGGDMFDWYDLCGRMDFLCYAAAARLFRLDQIVSLPVDPASVWYRFRDRLIRKAVEHYSEAGAVATDRLHGMLLALMMGIPSYVRDNSYGKISNYIDTWLPDAVGPVQARWSHVAAQPGELSLQGRTV